jgi:signal transduction histidine kinase
MAEPRPIGIDPARIVASLTRASLFVGLGCTAILVLGCELFGGGSPLARTGELAVLLGFGAAILVNLLLLRLDLWPTLRRLAGATLRHGAPASAQVGTLTARLTSYPRRLSRALTLALVAAFPAALLVAVLLRAEIDRSFLPLLPSALLTAPLAAAAMRFAARHVLRPFLAVLPAPSSVAAFRGSLANTLSVMLALPASVAALIGLVYVAFAGAGEDERVWRESQERMVTAVAGAPDVVTRLPLLLAGVRSPRGAARVSSCQDPPTRLTARACRAAFGAGAEGPAGSWIERKAGIVFAAAPVAVAAGRPPQAVVVWSTLPPPTGADPLILAALALVIVASHLAGGALGRSLGRGVRPVAQAIARVGEPGDAGDPPLLRSRVAEVACLQEAVATAAIRLREMRRDENVALEALRETQAIRTQFLASVSHDLKGPLNAVLGFSELLLRGVEGPLGHKPREDVRLIYRAGEDLLGIINSILDSAKLEAGRVELQREWTPSVELISEAARHARTLIGDKDVTVQIQVQAGLPPVHVDAHRMGQALCALVSNAVKFTGCGVVTVRAKVEPDSETGMRTLRMDISDQGPGISEDDRSRIFHAFELVDSSTKRTVGGAGLGLYIAKEMVELHGGRIWFESDVGKGSTFSISLPLPKETPPPT